MAATVEKALPSTSSMNKNLPAREANKEGADSVSGRELAPELLRLAGMGESRQCVQGAAVDSQLVAHCWVVLNTGCTRSVRCRATNKTCIRHNGREDALGRGLHICTRAGRLLGKVGSAALLVGPHDLRSK